MRELKDITAAVFDLDGTLFDSTAAWEGVGERYLLSLGITPPPGLDEKLRCLSLPDGSRLLKNEFALEYPPEEIQAAIVRSMQEFYLHECPLKPGAAELLELLSSRGVGLAIATACDRALAGAALERLGVLKYFRGIFTCDGSGGKDRPEIFLKAAAAAGGAPETTAVFEDSLHAVQTAHAAGFLTATVADRSEPQQEALRQTADCYCGELSEYIRLFSR